MKSQRITLSILMPAVLLLGACSSDSDDKKEEETAETTVVDSEDLAAAEVPSGNIAGLTGESYEQLEEKVLKEYEDEGDVKLFRAGEPISPTAGVAEITWDITGFSDDSVEGTRIIATVQTDLPGDGPYQITNAISQPICARGASADGLCL